VALDELTDEEIAQPRRDPTTLEAWKKAPIRRPRRGEIEEAGARRALSVANKLRRIRP